MANDITAEMAKAELARRQAAREELARRQSGGQLSPEMQQNMQRFQQAGQQQQDAQQPQMGLGERMLRNVGAGLAYGGQDSLNLMKMMGNQMFAPAERANSKLAEIISPGLKERMDRSVAPLKDLLAPTQHNMSEAFGIKDPKFTDQLVQGVAEYLPFGIGGAQVKGPQLLEKAISKVPYLSRFAPEMAQQLAPGVAFGMGSNPDHPVAGGIEGGLVNMAGAPIVGALPAAWNGIKNYASKFGARGIADAISGDLNKVKDISKEQAYEMVKDNLLNNVEPLEKSAWDTLKLHVNSAENNGKVNFNNSDYVKALQDKLANLETQSASQSGFRRSNDEGIQLLQDYLKDSHGTLSSALEHNKALNKDYRNQITPGQSLPFDIVNYAKGNINQAIQKNLEAQAPEIKNMWDVANSSTGDKMKTFFEITSPKGVSTPSTFATLLNNKSPYTDTSKFVNDYIPKAGSEGIQKMEQFAKMMNDNYAAKNVLKQTYFEKAFDPQSANGVDVKKFLNQFRNLSDEQQSFLFNKGQLDQVHALEKLMQKNPDIVNKPTHSYMILTHTLPGLLGFAAGEMQGEGVLGGLTGAAIGIGTQAGLRALMSRPGAQKALIDRVLNPPGGEQGQIAQSIAKAYPYLFTPQIVGGNQ